MYLNLKHFGFLVLLFLLVFSACKKDKPIIDQSVITEWTPRINNVTASLQGYVVDKNDEAVVGATVTLDGNVTTTNGYGHFFFTDMTMNSKGTYVTVEKKGFFLGSRRFFPQTDSKNRVKIEMLTKDFIPIFQSTTGGSHTFDNADVQLTFPPNAIMEESTGEVYSGIVFVAAQYLDPNMISTFDQMPGNLQGINTENEEGALKTLGMIAVELQSENREKLNLAEGQTATVSVPAPAGVDDLPAEVPLWSFDKNIGLWVEEGVATLENGVYTGEVSHFSFWNWDIYAPLADFSAVLTGANSHPIQGVQVRITSSSFGAGAGYTDEIGLVSGMVPANEVLTLELHDPCGTLFYTIEVGPFAAGSENTENIIVLLSEFNSTYVSGTVTNCFGVAVPNSLIAIDSRDGSTLYFQTSSDGTFNNYVSPCLSVTSVTSLTLTAVDLENVLQSEPIELTINEENDLGNIASCEAVVGENILTITIGDVTQTYLGESSYEDNGINIVAIDSFPNNFFISINFQATEPGDYGGSLNNLEYLIDNNLDWSYNTNDPNDGGFENFNISVFTEENIKGSFSGNSLNIITGNFDLVEGNFSINPD